MTERTCSVEGCTNPVLARMLCVRHYRQHQTAGTLDRFPTRGRRTGGICGVEGCANKQHAREMCARHYREWLAAKNGSRQCSRYLCSSLAVLDGLCMRHYTRRKRTDDMKELRAARCCSVDGCNRPYDSNDLCQMHYQRLRTTGSHGPAELLRGVNGSGYIDPQGYRVLTLAGGRKIGEHRVVMERHLGRPLTADENVHHLNGDRADNRIRNLELWNTSQPSGQRPEDKVAWARQMLALYGDNFIQPRLTLPD